MLVGLQHDRLQLQRQVAFQEEIRTTIAFVSRTRDACHFVVRLLAVAVEGYFDVARRHVRQSIDDLLGEHGAVGEESQQEALPDRVLVRFKWDTQINPNLDSSLTPCNVRLSPQEAVDLEFSIPARAEEYRDYFEDRKEFRSSRLFSCGAGSQTFHIDPYGKMSMCILLRGNEKEFSLKERSFKQIWDEMFPPIYRQMRSADHQCNSCNLISLCGKCPAWSEMEKGDMAARVEYSCEVGHRRAEKLGYWDGAVDQYTRTLKSAGSEQVLLPVLQSTGGCK